MASINKVVLLGNLGRDPEVRYMPSGGKVVNLRIATSESWKDRQSGERKERTEWHQVVIFNENIADVAEKYLTKGSSVYVEGQLTTRKWTDQQGVEKYSTEIVLQRFRGELVLLGGKGEREGEPLRQEYQAPSMPAPRGGGPRTSRPTDDLDDDVPFAPCTR